MSNSKHAFKVAEATVVYKDRDGTISLMTPETDRHFFKIDGIAAEAFTLLEDGKPFEQVVTTLSKKHKWTPAKIQAGAEQLLRDLRRYKLITSLTATFAFAFLSGCSMDVIPVHYSRVKSAQEASRPLARGPSAPGYFTQAWSFPAADGFIFDPSQVEVAGGAARLRGALKGDRATIESTKGFLYTALDDFNETAGNGNEGTFRYQLSPNGSSWYFYDGKKWKIAGPNVVQANSAADLKTAIKTFHDDVGAGTLFVKAYLVPAADKTVVPPRVALQKIEVAGIAPKTDSWD